MQKKYERVVSNAHSVSTDLVVVGSGLEMSGIALIATVVGPIPGIEVPALEAGAFIAEIMCAIITHKCSKAAKHAAVMQVARVS